MSEKFDWLTSRISEADEIHFVSGGGQTLGRPREIRRGFIVTFWRRGRVPVSSVCSEADRTQCDYKSTFSSLAFCKQYAKTVWSNRLSNKTVMRREVKTALLFPTLPEMIGIQRLQR